MMRAKRSGRGARLFHLAEKKIIALRPHDGLMRQLDDGTTRNHENDALDISFCQAAQTSLPTQLKWHYGNRV